MAKGEFDRLSVLDRLAQSRSESQSRPDSPTGSVDSNETIRPPKTLLDYFIKK
jgi:hypothetical protein